MSHASKSATLHPAAPHKPSPASTKPALVTPPTKPSQSRGKRLSIILIVILTILACMLDVIVISKFVLINKSLRLDESQSMWQSSHSLGGLLRVVAEDVHVPLYHLILHFWQLYFGNGVATVRALSLIFFLASIPLFYWLTRQILSVGWSLFAVVVFSFSPFMNWYGNEARMYTLLALLSILNQLFFVKIIKKDKGWLGYGISAIIGAYSHYFFMFNLAAQGVFYLLNRSKFERGSFKKLVTVAVLVIAALSPWLWYFHSLGSGSNTSPLLPAPSTVDFFNAFSQFAFGFQNDHINTILVSMWPLLILIGFFAIRRNQKIPDTISYMFTAAFVPVLLAYIISLTVTPFFLSRYMISVIAPLTIVVVWFISHYPRKLAVLAATLVLIVMIPTSVQQDVSYSTPVKEDYRGAAEMIQHQAKPQDIVVLSAPFTVYPFEYYYHGTAAITTLPIWDRVSPGAIPPFSKQKLPQEVKTVNQSHHYVYLLLSQDQGYESNIKQYFQGHFQKIESHHFSNDLNLYVYQVGYNKVPAL